MFIFRSIYQSTRYITSAISTCLPIKLITWWRCIKYRWIYLTSQCNGVVKYKRRIFSGKIRPTSCHILFSRSHKYDRSMDCMCKLSSGCKAVNCRSHHFSPFNLSKYSPCMMGFCRIPHCSRMHAKHVVNWILCWNERNVVVTECVEFVLYTAGLIYFIACMQND